MKIVIDDKIPYIKGLLEPFADVVYLPGNKIDAPSVQDADALIIRTRTICNESLLKNSSIKIIATATIGFDHIDIDYCAKNHIAWYNAPGCNSGSVKQYVSATIAHLIIHHNFNPEGKTIGIVGVGNVGKKIADVANAFGMSCLQNDPPRQLAEKSNQFVDIDTIARESDIITFHTPLEMSGEFKTFHLVDDAFLSRLKPNCFIINSSRGEVIDNQAIKKAVLDKKLGGAILDVWEDEPAIDIEFMRSCVIATPHIAGYSADGKSNGTRMSVEKIAQFFNLPKTDFSEVVPPNPTISTIEINCDNKSDYQVVAEVILQTYPIQEDVVRLLSNPDGFEAQRGNYPLRREFEAYQVVLKNGSDKSQNILNLLGFSCVTKY